MVISVSVSACLHLTLGPSNIDQAPSPHRQTEEMHMRCHTASGGRTMGPGTGSCMLLVAASHAILPLKAAHETGDQ